MTEATKWVFLSHTSRPGGAELSLVTYLTRSSLRNKVLVSFESGGAWSALEGTDVQLRVIEGRRWSVRAIAALRAEVRSCPDAVLVANTMRMALLSALFMRRKQRVIYWVRDGLTASSTSRVAAWLTRTLAIRRMAGFIANSRWTADTISMSLPRAQISVVASPCGVGRYRECSAALVERADEGTSGTTVRLLYLGRIAEWKAPDVAIRAIQELNRYSNGVTYSLDLAGAALFGEEAYEQRVRYLASSAAHVRFLGHVQDPVTLMRNYDGLVHCSILPEPFGQVVVQSMAAGLVTFASNAGGPKEIIADGVSGILYEPGDPHDLACRMKETFSDPFLTERLRNGGRKRSRDFVDEKLVRLLDQSMFDLTNG